MISFTALNPFSSEKETHFKYKAKAALQKKYYLIYSDTLQFVGEYENTDHLTFTTP